MAQYISPPTIRQAVQAELSNVMNNNIIGISPDEAIYRIIPASRFIEILEKNKLTLTHPSKWDDPFENAILSSEIKYGRERGDIESIRAGVFGQCWTSCKESDAMWQIYSQDKKGVRIKTTPRKLLNALYESVKEYPELHCFIGQVIYKDIGTIWNEFQTTSDFLTSDGSGIAKTLFLKRIEFAAENEVRLVYANGPRTLFHTFDINPNELIEEVTLDSRASVHSFNTLKAQASQLQYSGVINRSTLYDAPSQLTFDLNKIE